MNKTDNGDDGEGWRLGMSESEQAVLERITAASLEDALDGFQVRPLHTAEKLAAAVRAELRISMIMTRDVSWVSSGDFNRRGPRGGPDRKGNADVRDELLMLSKLAEELALKLDGRSSEAAHVLWMHGFWLRPKEKRSQPSQHVRLLASISHIRWVSGFLRDAASGSEKQRARWVDAEKREQRIFHAHLLSAVYEWGFGKPATLVSWSEVAANPWPDFFLRIMRLSFGTKQIPSLRKVLQEARRRHKDSGSLFDPEKLVE